MSGLVPLFHAFRAASRPLAIPATPFPGEGSTSVCTSVEASYKPPSFRERITITGWAINHPVSAHKALAQPGHLAACAQAAEAVMEALMERAPILRHTPITLGETIHFGHDAPCWGLRIHERCCLAQRGDGTAFGPVLEEWIESISGLPAGERRFTLSFHNQSPLTLAAHSPEDALELAQAIHPSEYAHHIVEQLPLGALYATLDARKAARAQARVCA